MFGRGVGAGWSGSRWRRIVAVPLVALSMLVSSVVAAPSAGAYAGFGDVEGGAFYTPAVQWMVDNVITLGVTGECFEPYTPIDRGQAAVFMWRMEGETAPSGPHGFTDVPAWMADAVAWMVEQGVTLGTTPTTFSPGQILTRAELVTFLWRLAGQPAPASSGHPFTDIVAGAFYYTAVLWAVEQGITLGTTTTTFSPGDTVTRGQVATFFYRYKDEPAVTVDPASPLCRGRDDFNGALQAGWTWAFGDPALRSFTEMPGYLSMGAAGNVGHNLLLREPAGQDHTIETKVSYAPGADFQAAGLTIEEAGDDTNAVTVARGFCSICTGDGIYADDFVNGVVDSVWVPVPPGTDDVWLRIEHESGTYTVSYSFDGSTWFDLASTVRVFADPRTGLFNGRSQVGPAPTAHFDYFAASEL